MTTTELKPNLEIVITGLDQLIEAINEDADNHNQKIGKLTVELSAFSNDPGHPTPHINARVSYAEMVHQTNRLVEGTRCSKNYFLEYNPTAKAWYQTSVGL